MKRILFCLLLFVSLSSLADCRSTLLGTKNPPMSFIEESEYFGTFNTNKMYFKLLRAPNRLGRESRTLYVVIHGLAEQSSGMKSVVNGLLNEGKDVLVLDLLGHGKSLSATSTMRNYSIEDQGASVFHGILNLTAIGEYKRIALIGHSLGGAVAVEVAHLAQINRIKIKNLTLIEPYIYHLPNWYGENLDSTETGRLIKMLDFIAVDFFKLANLPSEHNSSSLGHQIFMGMFGAYLKNLAHLARDLRAHTFNNVLGPIIEGTLPFSMLLHLENNPELQVPNLDIDRQILGAFLALPRNEDIREKARGLHIPTQIIAGSKESSLAPHELLREFANNILPNAKLLIVPTEISHFPHIDNTAAIVKTSVRPIE